MNSNNKKIVYRFRIHNEEEMKSITKFIKNRKFGVLYSIKSEWKEYEDLEQFMNDYENEDVIIRLYFNNICNMYKIQEKIRKVLPKWLCGNFDCRNEECEWNPNTNKGSNIEYIWRCILYDEEHFTI